MCCSSQLDSSSGFEFHLGIGNFRQITLPDYHAGLAGSVRCSPDPPSQRSSVGREMRWEKWGRNSDNLWETPHSREAVEYPGRGQLFILRACPLLGQVLRSVALSFGQSFDSLGWDVK